MCSLIYTLALMIGVTSTHLFCQGFEHSGVPVARVEQKKSSQKKICFHQSSYFLRITQGKVICNFITLYLGNIPLVNFINEQKEQGGILLYQGEICAYFSPITCKATVVILCVECRIFGQCQREILVLDKTSGS